MTTKRNLGDPCNTFIDKERSLKRNVPLVSQGILQAPQIVNVKG